MGAKILLVVEGMYLQADSIAYDAAFQYRTLKALGADVEVFVDRFGPQYYPDIPARPIAELERALAAPPACVLYHWVDGWHEMDGLLRESGVPTVVRWHNNTPPWFFAPYSPIPTQKTVRGFADLLRFAEHAPSARFWVNSEFSRRQLAILGIDDRRTDIVFPASYDIEHGPPTAAAPAAVGASDRPGASRAPSSLALHAPSTSRGGEREIRLLFVGRVVPHKGHRHALAAAHALQRLAGRPVKAIFPGRSDPDMPRYPAELRALAARLDVGLDLPGEISHDALVRAYAEAHAFIGLSEHEGFGLPIIEAMVRRLPVVGYRSTAVAELLADHPLACDDLDPLEVARRILVVVDNARLREAIVDWQSRVVLPRYAKDVVVGQLRAAVEPLGIPLAADPSARAASLSPDLLPRDEIATAIDRLRSAPRPALDLEGGLPCDLRDHLVTRYDLSAYQTLLRTSANGSLRERALDFRFGSHRPFLGKVLSVLKRMSLRLQDGLVRTIEISHNDLEHDLAALSDKIDLLAAEVSHAQRRTGDERSDRRAPVARPTGDTAADDTAAEDTGRPGGAVGQSRPPARLRG